MSNKVRRIYLDEKAGIFDYDLDGEHVLMPWSEYERLRAENCRFRSALERYTPDILDEMEADDE